MDRLNTPAKDEATAKAAAQTDYDQRIHSAIVSAPRQRELAEARAEIERIHSLYGFEQRGRLTAEAERDALATDKARLVEALRRASITVKRYVRAGYGDDVFMADLCETDRAIDAALSGASIPAPALAEETRSLVREPMEWTGQGRYGFSSTVSAPIPAPADKAEERREATAKPWPEPGDKMRFLNANGYDYEREAAAKILTEGQVVTVMDIAIGSFSHSIKFEEIPGRWNGVMFALISTPARGEGE